MFKNQLNTLSDYLKNALPGEESHLEVSPLGRGKSSDALKKAQNAKESAVSLVLFEESNILKSVLIQRSVYNGAHSGQISLPGGKRDDLDADLRDTALRECEEEIGIPKDELIDVGMLTPVYIPVSNFSVFPFVFFHPSVPQFTRDPKEVVDIIVFDIKEICFEESLKQTSIPLSRNQVLNNVPCFVINDKIVWGATALVLNEFRRLLMNTQLL
jgi:8-oxo-dGTP pyrophosphatase MutT (NUDIX family)